MPRLPLVPPLESRDGTSLKDGHMTNVLVEAEEQGDFACVRSGLVERGSQTGDGRGLVAFNGQLLSIYGSTLKAWQENLQQGIVALAPSGAEYGQLSVAYNGTRWVMVAEGTMAYSDDGLNWTSYALPVTSSGYGWSSITYGAGKFVMVSSGDFAYSVDGINWTVVDWTGSYSAAYVSIYYAGGRFVAVSYVGDLVASSADGVSWSYASTLGNNNWTQLIGNSSVFVAFSFGSATTKYSTDGGLTWSTGSVSYVGVNWTGSAVNGERLCVISSEGDVLHSDDGISWSGNAYLPGPAGGWVCGVSGGLFVAMGYNALGDFTFSVLSSPDAVSWTDTGIVLNEIYDMIGAGGNGDKFVAFDQYDRLALMDLRNPVPVEASQITGNFFDFAQSTF